MVSLLAGEYLAGNELETRWHVESSSTPAGRGGRLCSPAWGEQEGKRGASGWAEGPQDPLGRWLKSKFAGPAPKSGSVRWGWAGHLYAKGMHDSEARGPGTTTFRATHRGPGPGTRVPQCTAAL